MNKNDTAPDFNLTLENGSSKSLYSLTKDKTTVLFFYPSSASYSKTCQKQAAAFNDALTQLGENVQVVGVAMGSISELETFKQKFASGFPVGIISKDTQLTYNARRTGISSFLPDIMASKRVTFIIRPDHIIAERVDLPAKANGPEMTAHVQNVVAIVKSMQLQQPPETKSDSDPWSNKITAPSKGKSVNF